MHILKEKKLKSTMPRREIVAVFEKGHRLLNAEDIFNKVKKKGIDLATVYRTLQSFEKHHIIKKVDVRLPAEHYELADHHHHHVVCTSCGEIESFEHCSMDAASKKVLGSSKKFASIQDHAFEFFGLCHPCARMKVRKGL
jgi:Fe2+ or Zn2+ uptake regulation protein